MVRKITAGGASKCKFLGVLDSSEGNGFDIVDDKKGALSNLRNQVALMGGNAFVVSEGTSNSLRTWIQAEAYSCPVK